MGSRPFPEGSGQGREDSYNGLPSKVQKMRALTLSLLTSRILTRAHA